MMRPTPWLMICALAFAGCGPTSAPPDAATQDADAPEMDADTAETDADTRDDAGAVDAGPTCDCDDGLECTRDVCAASGCVHTPDHNRCEEGWFCTPAGCAVGGVCASDADCPTDTDPCTQRMRCDLESRQCTWERLDGDGDGHAPLVCGGGDCADATSEVGPDATEVCNGVDDDCDGSVDGEAASTACGSGLQCEDATCVCEAGQSWCGEALGCRVVTGDPLACGTCETACTRRDALCNAGTCECPAGRTECSDACADLSADVEHCGGCDNACIPGAVCAGGECACPTGTSACSVGCVALETDPTHCGACETRCLDGAPCAGGACTSTISFLRGFQSASSRPLKLAGLLTHPSGEVTMLVAFDGNLDELPFRALAGDDGYYLTRRSSTGAELWSRTIVANTYSARLALVGAPGREEVAVVGDVSSPIDFGDGTVAPPNRSVVIARYDGSGALTWKRLIDGAIGSSGPSLEDAAMHDDGDVALLVSTDAPTSFGGATLAPNRVVARYAAADGAHLASWGLPKVGTRTIRAEAIAAGVGDVVAVAGAYTGGAVVFGATILPGPSGEFVASYDGSGTASAAFNVAAPIGYDDVALDLASDGDIYIVATDTRLARYAPDGTVRWMLPRTGGTGEGWTQGFSVGRDGQIVAYGRHSGHFDIGTGPFRSADGSYVAVYGSDGTIVSALGIEASSRSTRLVGFVRAGAGGWLLTGTFTEAITLQDRTLALTNCSGAANGLWFASINP